MTTLSFVKGHGTANDFLVIPDLAGDWSPYPEQIRWLCDRRRGIGADGILRVVPTSMMEGASELCPDARYFMDYRNADGSPAEMCGNGVRVFARYLLDNDLESGSDFLVGTRAGCVPIRVGVGAEITAALPNPIAPFRSSVSVSLDGRTWPATGVLAPNPHAVVLDVDLEALSDIDLAPVVIPPEAFPEGVNVEFVEYVEPGRIRMRVVERGVGETLSCGTGACAAAWAAADAWDSQRLTWCVEVPGGELRVDLQADGHVLLTGPAELIAEGHVTLP